MATLRGYSANGEHFYLYSRGQRKGPLRPLRITNKAHRVEEDLTHRGSDICTSLFCSFPYQNKDS